jgi:hypothetical protein
MVEAEHLMLGGLSSFLMEAIAILNQNQNTCLQAQQEALLFHGQFQQIMEHSAHSDLHLLLGTAALQDVLALHVIVMDAVQEDSKIIKYSIHYSQFQENQMGNHAHQIHNAHQEVVET